MFEKWRNSSRPARSAEPGLWVSVNLSTRDLLDRTSATSWLPFWIATVYWHRRFAWRSPESAIMDDPSRAEAMLNRLSSRASSYPSTTLARAIRRWRTLKRLPVDELKIDKSFCDGHGAGEDDAMIVPSPLIWPTTWV